MTDKLYPDWVSDRLPTEEEIYKQCVLLWSEHDNEILNTHTAKLRIEDTWTPIPKELIAGGHKQVWIDFIATPDECLAREKEKKAKSLREAKEAE